jgi:hypothetical protein
MAQFGFSWGGRSGLYGRFRTLKIHTMDVIVLNGLGGQ